MPATPHSTFRMHAASQPQRDRMKKWLEAKQRRQVVDGDDGSVASIVSTGDELPQPMDRDDSAYHGRTSGRSRVGTIQSYRDALLSPKRTRDSVSNVHSVLVVPTTKLVDYDSGDDEERPTPSPTSAPTVQEATAVEKTPRRVERTVKSAPVVDTVSEEDSEEVRPSSSKRRRIRSKRSAHRVRRESESPSAKRPRFDSRGLPLPPSLASDDDLPTVMDIFNDGQNKPDPRIRTSAGSTLDLKPRRLFQRSDAAHDRQDLFLDDEAMEDEEDGLVVSADEVETGGDHYDYADSFIDDSSVRDMNDDSDTSMHSAHSRKRRLRSRRSSPHERKHSPDVDHDTDARPSKEQRVVSLSSPFKVSATKVKTTREGSTRVAAFPMSSEVLEITSGSEDEQRSSRPALPQANAHPVVKIERDCSPSVPCSRPKPRPIAKKGTLKAKVLPDSSSGATVNPVDSNLKDVPPSSSDRKGKMRQRSDAPTASATHGSSLSSRAKTEAKGKQRARLDVVSGDDFPDNNTARFDPSVLHPDERRDMLRAIQESLASSSPSRGPGESSSAGSSSSTAPPPPPVTPRPSGRIRMADLIANAAASSPVTPSPRNNGESYLEDLTAHRRCTALPDKCEVWDPEAMDPVLRAQYDGLCNLRPGRLIPWMDTPGKGFMQFSMWADWCPDMNGGLAYDAINFTESGNIRNPSRVSPLGVLLRTVPQTTNRYNFYCDTTPAVPLVATSALFLEASQLMKPSNTGLRQKFIRGGFHGYEWERLCGFVSTASGFPSLHAQLARDYLQFSTRATPLQKSDDPEDKQSTLDAKGKRVPIPGMFKSPSGRGASSARAAGDNFSLASDAIVPVYDARTYNSLDFASVLPRLSDTLPIYTGGEIPYGSFVMVGYTMTIYRSNAAKWTLGCNLLWVILIGSPQD